MDKLLVETKMLKPEYLRRERLWKLFVRRFCLILAKVWNRHALIAYPLMIEIQLGVMQYHYFKFGIEAVARRIFNYNLILMSRLKGNSTDLDPEDFYLTNLLTDEQEIKDQLHKELLDYV
jgi:hypothetical protein